MGRPKKRIIAAGSLDESSASIDPASESVAPDRDEAWLARVRENLVAWYRSAGRSLPWRSDHDPYRILVSEMMLVQTTVTAVIPYFARFLARFPTVAALAEADESDVLKAWEGLGYYRRARQLHAAAQAIVAEHGGTFPRDPAAIRALPGVGRYIAGAVLSFAFDEPAPIVEANTQRVLARWLAWPDELQTTRSQTRLWEAAGRLVPQTGAGEFNQAFMELGALVCVPRAPLCLACPVAGDCLARRLGAARSAAGRRAKPAAEGGGRGVRPLIRRATVPDPQARRGPSLGAFLGVPDAPRRRGRPGGRSLGAEMDLAPGFEQLTGVRVDLGPVATSIRFGVTTHRVALDVHPANWVEGDSCPARPGWVESSLGEPPGLLGDYTRWARQPAASSPG